MAAETNSRPPCASCKQLRRRCTTDCVFAPYFPVEDRQQFDTVHRIYGSSNVARMLQDLPAAQRADAVSSLVYEANSRKRDPVYGCAGAIYSLQQQIARLQMQLALARAQMLRHHHSFASSLKQQHLDHHQQHLDQHMEMDEIIKQQQEMEFMEDIINQQQEMEIMEVMKQKHKTEIMEEDDLMTNSFNFNDVDPHHQLMMDYSSSRNSMLLQEGSLSLKNESLWTPSL